MEEDTTVAFEFYLESLMQTEPQTITVEYGIGVGYNEKNEPTAPNDAYAAETEAEVRAAGGSAGAMELKTWGAAAVIFSTMIYKKAATFI